MREVCACVADVLVCVCFGVCVCVRGRVLRMGLRVFPSECVDSHMPDNTCHSR